MGTIYVCAHIYIMMYFDRYRGIAHGMSLIGSTVSGFLFTRLLHFLRQTYGFHQSLFLLGALTMNISPMSRLFRTPPWCRTSDKIELSQHDHPLSATRPDRGSQTMEIITEPRRNVRNCSGDTCSLAHSPQFYIIVFSTSVTFFIDSTYLSTMIDFAIDKGAPVSQAVSLTSFFYVNDAVGRVFLPLFADKGCLRRTTLMSLNQLSMGCVLLLASLANSYWKLALLHSLSAALAGCGFVMHDVLIADFLGVERISVVHGVVGVARAPLMLCGPIIVGRYAAPSSHFIVLERSP